MSDQSNDSGGFGPDIVKMGDGLRMRQTNGRDGIALQAQDGNIIDSSFSQGRGADIAWVTTAIDSPFEIRNLHLNGGQNHDLVHFELTSFHDATITNNHDGTYSLNAPSQRLHGIRFTQYELVGFQQIAGGPGNVFEVRLQDIEAATQRTPTINVRDLLHNRPPTRF